MSNIDTDIFYFINGLAGKNGFLDFLGVFFAKYLLYFLIIGLILLWFYPNLPTISKNQAPKSVQVTLAIQKSILFIIFSIIFAVIFGKIAGIFYSHNNPFAVLPNVNLLIPHAVNNSFPSDHTLVFMTLSGCLFMLRKPSYGFLAALAGILVALSRIFVGVHYPIDTLVSVGIALIAVIFCYATLPRTGFLGKLAETYQKTLKKLHLTK